MSLRVLRPGLLSTIQDLGRFGFQKLGVPVAGALDPIALRLANALVGNGEGEGAIEISYLGPRLEALAPTRIAVTGPARVTLSRDGQTQDLAPWRTHLLAAGDVLDIGPVNGAAVAYLAVAGGFALAPVLGSLSTYLRAAIGPLDGGPLREGMTLPLRQTTPPAGPEIGLAALPDYGDGAVRVVLGPQQDHFTDDAVARFLSEPYHVGKQADRMGLRLSGPKLEHQGGADIASEGLVAGAIQVPGNGEPILLLADHQTAGGYAKIATVISADLPRVGRMVPGQDIRFAAVTVAEAEAARRSRESTLRHLIAGIAPVPPEGGLDVGALYESNLISGVAAPEDEGHAG